MSLKHLARHALSLPFHIAVAKSAAYAGRIIKSHVRQVSEYWRCSYQTVTGARLDGALGGVRLDLSNAMESNLRALLVNIIDHRFDLLGSGWVSVSYIPDVSQLSSGNRVRSAVIRGLIGSGYSPIDWQLDFKSGYRWRADRLSGTLRYGHEPGVDVKVPWELARLQHLPWLALIADERAAREFRNQVLDFAAANPPGYGVNWLCTMDVALRAANILVAYDLFAARGTVFDEAFLGEFHALILAHGKHISGNLEWHEAHRGNHYLADIIGLLFVSAYLPRATQTDAWLAFAVRQLIDEVERQFTPDGANFEASTSYHRLSAEMVIYGTALVLGLSEDKCAALEHYDHGAWQHHPSLPPAPVTLHVIPGSDKISPFPPWYFERLERMAEFSVDVTKANGRIAQIGDNDSGRLFKLCPIMEEGAGSLVEQHLDHRATVAAINGLFGCADLAAFSGPDVAFESAVVGTLASRQAVASYRSDGHRVQAVGSHAEGGNDDWRVTAETIIVPPDSSVFDGLETVAYPDFGLYIWRSPRLFLALRCGPIGQNGNGGHAHNDQLAVELNIDGEDWAADPGSYLYTPSVKDRDAYRSVHAHAAPRIGEGEPGRLDLGLFRLGDQAKAHCRRFDAGGFEGMHVGFGHPVHRRVTLGNGRIHIFDGTGGEVSQPITVTDAASLKDHWSLTLPFSPGYGLREPL